MQSGPNPELSMQSMQADLEPQDMAAVVGVHAAVGQQQLEGDMGQMRPEAWTGRDHHHQQATPLPTLYPQPLEENPTSTPELTLATSHKHVPTAHRFTDLPKSLQSNINQTSEMFMCAQQINRLSAVSPTKATVPEHARRGCSPSPKGLKDRERSNSRSPKLDTETAGAAAASTDAENNAVIQELRKQMQDMQAIILQQNQVLQQRQMAQDSMEIEHKTMMLQSAAARIVAQGQEVAQQTALQHDRAHQLQQAEEVLATRAVQAEQELARQKATAEAELASRRADAEQRMLQERADVERRAAEGAQNELQIQLQRMSERQTDLERGRAHSLAIAEQENERIRREAEVQLSIAHQQAERARVEAIKATEHARRQEALRVQLENEAPRQKQLQQLQVERDAAIAYAMA